MNTLSQHDRNELAVQHYDMARAIAGAVHRRIRGAVDIDDLIGAATSGLVEASRRYDPSRKVPFGKYAKTRIHGSVVDLLRQSHWVPRSVRQRANHIENTRDALHAKTGRIPSQDELRTAMGMSPLEYDRYRRDAQIRKVVSLDARIDVDNPTPIVEQIAGDQDLDSELLQRRLEDRLRAEVERLPERERVAVTLYYLHEFALKEIGQVLGVTESRACQLRSQGVRRMRRRVQAIVG